MTASTSTAQSAPDSHRPTIGLEGGLSVATLSAYNPPVAIDAFDTGFRRGLSIGAFVEVPVRAGFSLRPTLSFVQKGAVIKFAPDGGADSASVDLQYLDAAALVMFSPSAGVTRPYVNVGPTFGVKLGATVDASAGGGSSRVDVSSQVRTADVGIAVGAGVIHQRWSVGARFAQGVIDIGNTRQVSDVVRTRTMAILAGVRF